MSRSSSRSTLAAMLVAACASSAAIAAKPPADPCSLLKPAEVAKVVGHDVGEPKKSVAPRPYRNTAEGTDCIYEGKGRGSLMFRIYFDASPSESAELFKKLQAFFGGGTSAPGIGDETYFDSKHALHTRKGNARFFMEVNGTHASAQEREKQLGDLGRAVSGRL